jgi:hypothetical protein
MRQIAACCCLATLLAYGCASVGTPIARQNLSRIQKGVTTERELTAMFGAPSDKSIDSNDRVILTWIHSAAQVKGTTFIPYAGAFVGGTNVQVEKLMVVVGKDGTVENYVFNESHPNVQMGVGQ